MITNELSLVKPVLAWTEVGLRLSIPPPDAETTYGRPPEFYLDGVNKHLN
jgi:hypothetical protein